MKTKTFLTLLFLAISFTLTAQENTIPSKTKGTYFTGGSILASHNTTTINNNSTSELNLEFLPKGGYFIMDNLGVGLQLSILSSSQKQDTGLSDIKINTTAIGILPFARYYFYKNFFGEAAIGFGFQNSKVKNSPVPTDDQKTTSYGFRLSAGYSFALSQNVAIEPIINYAWQKNIPKDTPDSHKENLSQIFLGIGVTAFF